MNKKNIILLFSLLNYINISFTAQKEGTKKKYNIATLSHAEAPTNNLIVALKPQITNNNATGPRLLLINKDNNAIEVSSQSFPFLLEKWKLENNQDCFYNVKIDNDNQQIYKIPCPDNKIIQDLENICNPVEKNTIDPEKLEQKTNSLNYLIMGTGVACLSIFIIFLFKYQQKII